MAQPKFLRYDAVPENLLVALDNREVALWVADCPEDSSSIEELARFIGLPWRLVLLEISNPQLIEALEKRTQFDDSAVKKRGFVQIIDRDPSQIDLPRRSLPVYLLNGRQDVADRSFQSRYRRLSMLEELRRSGVSQLLVVSGGETKIYEDLEELWSSGFTPSLTFVNDKESSYSEIEALISKFQGLNAAAFLNMALDHVVGDALAKFTEKFPEDSVVIRVRNRSNELIKFNVTDLDDPERPLFDYYDMIQERNLSFLTPEQLSEEEFVSFFQNPQASWAAYAAGLPWERQNDVKSNLKKLINRLDSIGPDESCIAYITAEPGAGGTTLARMLAWDLAQKGYPALVAKNLPFTPDPISVGNFLNRVRVSIEETMRSASITDTQAENTHETVASSSRYETPWVIVFDRIHWEYRDTELRRFRNEMQKLGRPVCVLVVTGPIREWAFYDDEIFHEIANLNHYLGLDEARVLGRHLNKFLQLYGKPRSDDQWSRFHSDHSVKHADDFSVFWVALSFWIQGQYDLSESIQEWMYKCFVDKIDDEVMRAAILEIAAMSSVRLPMPESLLSAHEKWPISHLLRDKRSELGPLGLVEISAADGKYWALAHDILGRFLLTALHYDSAMMRKMGLETATTANHLRFMLLARISKKSALGDIGLRSLGDDFATTIFKLDPNHGHGDFVPFWKEVFEALDAMPQALRDASRVFRHHTAISRRRITTLDEKVRTLYGVTVEDRFTLLNKAIGDVTYALGSIDRSPGSEPNLNLHNTLSLAYHNLAEVQELRGVSEEEITRLREAANHEALRAYEEDPANTFVVETYVRNLLARAGSDSENAVELCVEAMNILFSAISSDEETYRRKHLGDWADQALNLLTKHTSRLPDISEPSGPIEVLTKAWSVMTRGINHLPGGELFDLPEENRIQAIDVLSHPEGRGNNQVLRLKYGLVGQTYSYDYSTQLETLEQLIQTGYRLTAQIKLEYAILLYQMNRTDAGDKEFRYLRRLWRETEQFVRVPNHLRWLRGDKIETARKVQAIVASDWNQRAMAKVREFQNISVMFRPEEFGMNMGDLRPGVVFQCCVSFGHNGPFLRPISAAPNSAKMS